MSAIRILRRPAVRGATLATLVLLAAATAGAAPKSKMATPTLACAGSTQVSINVQVCAGATGAPAGFTLQWLSAADLAANGGAWPSGVCDGSFSGNANGSRYALGPGECVTVNVGDLLFDNGTSSSCPEPLLCGTDYVFRAFAHANSTLNRSEFTANRSCSTLPCGHGDSCTFTQGYWKTHGPEGCATGNNFDTWPVTELALGDTTYSDLELCSIFNTPAAGNGLISLAHQLMAAKLNVAAGADDSAIAVVIAAADALIAGQVVPPVGGGSLAPGVTSTLNGALANWNEGLTGPGHCGD